MGGARGGGRVIGWCRGREVISISRVGDLLFFVVIVIAVAVAVAVVAYNISTKGSSFLLEGAKVWSQQKTGQSASRGISKSCTCTN